MDKLEPCPFCGGEGEGRFGKWSQGYPVSTVFCKSCDAKAYAQTEAGAIAAWNRRPTPALCQRTLEAAAKACDDRLRLDFYGQDLPGFSGQNAALRSAKAAILALGKDNANG